LQDAAPADADVDVAVATWKLGDLEPGSDFLAGVICLYLSRKTSYWGPRLVARPFLLLLPIGC